MAAHIRLNLRLSLRRPEFFHHRKRQPLPPTPDENEVPYFEKREEGDSAEGATEWIKSTIREEGRWEDHLSLIRVDCPLTMGELRQLGRLSESEGTRQCRRMIRIPVLYDEIGCFLWKKLAALERGPDFGREEEERVAEDARGVTYRTTMALNANFRFDTPAATSFSGTTSHPAKYGRPRQDSEPISPTQVQRSQTQPHLVVAHHHHHHPPPSPKPPNECHFCQDSNTREHPAIPEDIAAEALRATRGRVTADQHHTASRGARLSRSVSPSCFNRSRSSSYTSTLLWRHEHRGPASRSSMRGPDGKSSRRSSGGGGPERDRRSRDGSIVGRVGSLMGSLGRGGGLAHGYGYGGRRGRSGSYWSV